MPAGVRPSRTVERASIEHAEGAGIGAARRHAVWVIVVVANSKQMGEFVREGGHTRRFALGG